jgi:hypothetical protein
MALFILLAYLIGLSFWVWFQNLQWRMTFRLLDLAMHSGDTTGCQIVVERILRNQRCQCLDIKYLSISDGPVYRYLCQHSQ